MNQEINPAAKTADTLTLVAASLVLIVAFIPPFNFLGIASGLIAAVAALVALTNPHLSDSMRWATLLAGFFLLGALVVDIIAAIAVFGTSSALAETFGFDPALVTGVSAVVLIVSILFNAIAPIIFIGQAFISRATSGRRVVRRVVAQQNVAVMPPQPAPVPQPAPAPQPMMAPPPQPAPPTRVAPPRPRANAWVVNMQSNQNHQLFRGDTRIGRSMERNDVILNSARVSREHALIREMNGRFVLYEVGAQQQVYVNDQPIRRQHVLQQEDVIQLGDTRLRFIQG